MYKEDTQDSRWARPWKVYGLVLLLGSPSVSYVLAAVPTGAVPAFEGKVLAPRATKSLQPYASTAIAYDDNLFRVSDETGEEGANRAPLASDIEYSVLAGLKVDLPISQQRLTADLSINHNHFERFDFLDYTGADVRTALKWAFGRNWGGEVGYLFDRSLASFEESAPIARDLTILRDIRTEHEIFAYGEREVLPHWNVRIGGDWSDAAFETREERDRDRRSGNLGLFHLSRAGNVAGVQAIYKDIDFSDQAIGVSRPLNNDYSEIEVNFLLDWAIRASSELEMRVGYTQRRHDERSGRDFDGPTARFNYRWKLTGKTSLLMSAWHELTDINKEIVNFAVSDGVSIEPTWSPTRKLALRLVGKYEHRDFRGDPESLSDLQDDREDDVYLFGISLRYDVLRNARVSIGYEASQRDSTEDFRGYESNVLTGTLLVSF